MSIKLMQRKIKNLVIIVAVILVVTAGGFIWWQQNSKPGKLDSFAQCLKSKGAVFYGAFWCPHCQDQKALFGSSAKYLHYVECSTPDSNGQLQICIQEKIKAYPTWQFSDSSREKGGLTLQQLSDKSGCKLPQ